jgi:hypothetical protein
MSKIRSEISVWYYTGRRWTRRRRRQEEEAGNKEVAITQRLPTCWCYDDDDIDYLPKYIFLPSFLPTCY